MHNNSTETATEAQRAAHANGPAQAAFVDYFRCPAHLAEFETSTKLSSTTGYFSFAGACCFGRPAGAEPAREWTGRHTDVLGNVAHTTNGPVLPFDLAEVVTNLREERYRRKGDGLLTRLASSSPAQGLYYLLRPAMPVGVRKYLQQLRLRGWSSIPFPRWPVDLTVDELMRQTMSVLLQSTESRRLPFIWFWPDGAPSCTMMTHDVEGESGLAFCNELMDLDDRFGLKAAFQLIPEKKADPWQHASEIRRRGYEVNLHDLNHDGRLYRHKAQFIERARRINDYSRQFGIDGFRSGAMYREQSWYDAFEFQYDMSVPTTAHLEPQRGGCCTVMPYFIGRILELPLTTVQDYSLFFILRDYSAGLWKEQIQTLLRQNGLISFITHPDYLIGDAERAVYIELLGHLARLRDEGQTWVAVPGEINRWWRDRNEMTLTAVGSTWRIDGPSSDRARVAYACLEGDRVVYHMDSGT